MLSSKDQQHENIGTKSSTAKVIETLQSVLAEEIVASDEKENVTIATATTTTTTTITATMPTTEPASDNEVQQLFSQLCCAFSEANQTISQIEPLFDFFEKKISWVEERINEIEREQDEFLVSENLKEKFEESCRPKNRPDE